jgi:nucleoside-diphosphate-sugar epimerase
LTLGVVSQIQGSIKTLFHLAGEMNMAKSVLLIGGAGYIGPVIAEELLKEGYSVKILDSLIYDNFFAISHLVKYQGFHFIEGDMGDAKFLSEAVQGVTDVVLLGGLVGDPISRRYPQLSRNTNEISVQTCIKYLSKLNLEHVVFISTCSNYGLIPEGHLADEDYPLSPLSPYSLAKVNAEKLLNSLKLEEGFSPTILRFATAFGLAPRMRFDLTVNEFTKEIVNGTELTVFDPDTWRPYCHVKDFATIVKLVIQVEPKKVAFQTFNAGSQENNFTKRQIIEMISTHINPRKVIFKDNGGDPRNYKVNFSKIKQDLGFVPSMSVADGISEIIEELKINRFEDLRGNKNRFGNYSLG